MHLARADGGEKLSGSRRGSRVMAGCCEDSQYRSATQKWAICRRKMLRHDLIRGSLTGLPDFWLGVIELLYVVSSLS